MIIRKLNLAEAVLEPYFDGGESDMRFATEKGSSLPHYTVETNAPALARVSQAWHAVSVHFDGCPADGAWLELRREAALDVSAYDTLRLFAAVPACVEAALLVKADGAWRQAGVFFGNDTTSEHDVPLGSARLEGFGYRFTLRENHPAEVTLHWLGLSHLARQAEYEAGFRGVFPPDWQDYLLPEGDFTPRLGLWFDPADTEALRRKVRSPHLKPYYDALLAKAESCLSMEPEREIGVYVPHPDRRWVRDRDAGRTETATLMTLCAFAGLMERRADLMRMAVRMALSAANCEYWCEGPMGTLPGCSWHHRSFTEEGYARGCAMVLDWAGGFFTPYGRTCVLDAIAMKALPRLESDFRRMEYIRHMNQGICFNYGRVAGLLAMAAYFPRYGIRLEEAERELLEIIDTYVLPDGGTMEGPGYWAYTFSQAMPQLYLLSRWHRQPFARYATPKLLKTGEHALALLSIQGNGTTTMPINDAHSGFYAPDLMAAFANMSDNPAYRQVLTDSLRAGLLPSGGLKAAPTPELLILVPEKLPPEGRYVRRGFTVLPELGQARIIREDPALGAVSFHLLGGPAYFGHFHHDKGSFVLETEAEALIADRGVTAYSHPDTGILQLAAYHNLLYPEKPDGTLCRQLPDDNDGTGARLTYARYREGVFDACTDTTGAWERDTVTHAARRVVSSAPGEYVLEDSLTLTSPMEASFRLNTRLPVECTDTGAVLRGERVDVYVEPVNWQPARVLCAPASIDEHLQPMNLLRLISAVSREHTLTTRLRVVPKAR